MSTMATTVFGASGAPIHVEQRGDGPPVLLLCGLTDAHDAWDFQLEGPLAGDFRLICHDNRGTGRSPLPADGTSIAQMAEDAARVLDALQPGPVHVCGFSGGGLIGQLLALGRPDLVRSLTLVGTFHKPVAVLEALAPTVLGLLQHMPEEEFLPLFLRWVYSDEMHRDGRVAQFLAAAAQHPYPPDPDGIVQYLLSAVEHDVRDRLHEITVPTLVIHGDRDAMIPLTVGREMAERLGAACVVFEGSGHQPFHEDPARFDEVVGAFWRSVE